MNYDKFKIYINDEELKVESVDFASVDNDNTTISINSSDKGVISIPYDSSFITTVRNIIDEKAWIHKEHWRSIGKQLVYETITELSMKTQFSFLELYNTACLINREDENQSAEEICEALQECIDFCSRRNIELCNIWSSVIVGQRGKVTLGKWDETICEAMLCKDYIKVGKNKEDYLENENVKQYFSSHPEQIKRVQKENRFMRKYGRERRGSR